MKQYFLIKKSIIPVVIAMVLFVPGYAQLNGLYTIGGTAPDYPTITAAVTALNNVGVSGPVTFNIRPGTYTERMAINNIPGANNTNRITIKSETNNAADVLVQFAPTATANNYIVRLNNASYVTIKHISVTTTSGSFGRLIELVSNASYNEVDNCILNAVGTVTDMACIYGTSLKGTDNKFTNNTLTGGYYGIYLSGSGNSEANATKNTIIENNTFQNIYYYSNYLYYQYHMKFRDNVITKTDNGTHYGMRVYYCNDGLEITGNTITLDGTGTRYGLYGYYNDGDMLISNNRFTITSTGTKYGMRLYYNDGTANNLGIILNNTIALDCGTSTGYGIFSYYSKYQNFINNSVSVNSTSTTTVAARFYYDATTYSNNNIVNNVFSNVTGSGYTLYIHSVNYNNYWDYNNIYNGKTNLVELISPAATYTTLPAWRNAFDQDRHSISYDPGFVSVTDLRPDVTNPACWSMNGRGLHIATNNRDINNNVRVELRGDGVPDLGAYEFQPTVLPPLAAATPAVASAGIAQVFSFGQNEVATVKWAINSVPIPLEVRQYSGEKGAGVAAAASPFGSMYFHTDIVASSSQVNFDLSLNYMDIWLGTITNEPDLRMAHKVHPYPWMVYNSTLSAANASTDVIEAPGLNSLGSFTGLEHGSIPSAFIRTNDKLVICIGNNVLLNAAPLDGDFYKWYLNGTEITGASGANYTSYNAMLPGSYTVRITYAGKIVESVPVNISTVAAPNAVVKANGPLTYCTGSGLVLDAGSVQAVSYQWWLNGVDIPGATNNTYQVTQAGDYRVRVENIGCASISTPTSVAAGPLNVNLGNDTSYCEIKNVYAKLDAGYPGATYTWSTGETTQTIEVKKAGKYTVHVDAGPNCADDDDIIVHIDPLPTAAGISFVQNGNTYQFFPSGPVGVTGVLWIFSDGTTTTQNNPLKIISGDLYVRMVMYNSCGTDTVQLGWPLSVSKAVADEHAAYVYPNPAQDVVSVKLSADAAITEISIVNALGAIVGRNSVAGGNLYTINIAHLPAGNYILKAVTDKGVINRQFSIVR